MIPTALDQLLSRGALTHATVLLGGDPSTHEAIAREIQQRLSIAPADAFHVSEPPAVDELRRILSRIHLKPNQSSVSGLFLHRLERWSAEASNTLLKTLEEPPVHARLVLFASDESAVLPTIRSRCAKYRLVGSATVDSALPTLAALGARPLADGFAELTAVSETVPVQEILSHWVATTSGGFRERLLERLTALGGRPVNRRLTLESILVEYTVAERTT